MAPQTRATRGGGSRARGGTQARGGIVRKPATAKKTTSGGRGGCKGKARVPPVDYAENIQDRNTPIDMLHKCLALKEKAESKCKAKLDALRTLLEFSYKDALDKLIEGSLKPASLKHAVCHYIALKMTTTREILEELISKLDESSSRLDESRESSEDEDESWKSWDRDDVIHLIIDVAENLNNVELIIPGLFAIQSIARSFFYYGQDKFPREKVVQMTRKLVRRLKVDLLSCDKTMRQWAKSPTRMIDWKY
ncbi:hypothetical protein V2J09_000125 [Rumex salicifolius]